MKRLGRVTSSSKVIADVKIQIGQTERPIGFKVTKIHPSYYKEGSIKLLGKTYPQRKGYEKVLIVGE